MTTLSSLYIHFPFCEAKCHYCDFYSIGRERTGEQDPLQFEAALARECARYADAAADGRSAPSDSLRLASSLDTIFFGGGTPSMTPPESMRRALAPLDLESRVTDATEWTMEANPSSVDLARLREYRAFGVNRISMGVQAMRDDLLARLGRVHSREAALRALDAIFAAGYANVSVDLLCGVPGQSIEDVESAMEALAAYPITHLSCYLLTLPKSHRMHRELPDEDGQLAHLLAIDRFMTARGFEHYEISNFAKPGKQARHNLAYWTGKGYLGLGPSAHSFSPGSAGESFASGSMGGALARRWKNFSSLHKWASALEKGESPIEWTEELSPEQRELEKWMLALRLAEGFPAAWLDNDRRRARAEAFRREGLLEAHPAAEGRLRLTPRGFAVSESVISALA